MRLRGIKSFQTVIVGLYFFCFLLPVYGQPDVERATQGIDRSFRKEAEEKLRPTPQEIPQLKKEERKPSEGPRFFIKKITLVGCESFSPHEFKSIIAEYENKEESFDDLQFLAKEIERAYLKKGVIAACFIPQQDLKDGTLTLQIIEAKMGQLDIPDHKYFRKHRIAYYWKIPTGEVLSYEKIMRSLYFINKNPDRQAKVTLYAGTKPQTTNVKFDVTSSPPMHFTGSFDREGAPYTGKERKGIGLRHNNFLGFDDTLLTGYTYGTYNNAIYVYHNVPVTNFGTTVMYGFSYSKSAPHLEYEKDGMRSYSKDSSVFVHQDLFKQGEYVGEAYGGLAVNDKSDRANAGTLDRDRLRTIQLGMNYQFRGEKSVTYVNPEVSQGINLFGAQRRNEFSTRNSINTFSKMNFNAQHKRMLPFGDIQLSLALNSQYACTRLPSSETFSLGGLKSVRGYPQGDARADHAVQTNTEFLLPAFFVPQTIKLPYATQTLKESITPVLFLDYGWGKRKPIGNDREYYNLASVGAGIRFRLYDQCLLRYEWGYTVGDRPLTEGGKSRFHFSLDFEDRLPQEIKKIEILREEEYIQKCAWTLLEKEMRKTESVLKKKLYRYFYLANAAYENGNLEKAKEYYIKVSEVGKSIYEQTKKYIEACFENKRELEEYNQMASRYYKEGDLAKAKEAWGKIIEKAKVKRLTLLF